MKRKIYYNLLLLATMFGITSCSQDTEKEELLEGEILISTEIYVDGQLQSRASTEAGYTTGAGSYHKNDPCTVAAYANQGYELESFKCVSGGTQSGSSSYTFFVTNPMRFVAKFKKQSSRFIAVGSDGYIVTPNGLKQVGTNDWICITYGNGTYVVGGKNGQITTSTDGINWNTPIVVSTNDTNNNWESIAYGNGKFVIGNFEGYLSSSSDGKNWTTPVKPQKPSQVSDSQWFPSAESVIYINGKFVALISVNSSAYIVSSTDGVNWDIPVKISTNYYLYDLNYGNGKFIAVGRTNTTNLAGSVVTSTDAVTWDSPIKIGASSWYSVAYGDGKYVLVGGDVSKTNVNGNIISSTDGTNWANEQRVKAGTLTDVIYVGGKFIAVGYPYSASDGGNIVSSTDGVNWSVESKEGTSLELSGVCAMP